MRFLLLLLVAALPLAACGGDASGDNESATPSPGSISDAAGAIEALPQASAPDAPAAPSGRTVVDVLDETPSLSTLARLVETAGLAETLTGEGPFTLFAPSDEALAGASLPSDPAAIRALLLAHALPFRTLAADLDFEQTVETMGGSNLDVIPGTPPAVASGGTRARVTTADLDAANGVVHVIDAVLPTP